jgi:hypothetical protein
LHALQLEFVLDFRLTERGFELDLTVFVSQGQADSGKPEEVHVGVSNSVIRAAGSCDSRLALNRKRRLAR